MDTTQSQNACTGIRFNKLHDAYSWLRFNTSKPYRIFSYEASNSGARKFIVCTNQTFWQVLQTSYVQNPHFYEVLHLGLGYAFYLDIEFPLPCCNSGGSKSMITEIVVQIQKFLRTESVVVLDSCSATKASFHIICPEIILESISKVKLLAICFKSTHSYPIDLVPYNSNQQFRMAFCSKRTKGIRLMRHSLTSWENLLLDDETFFVRSLIGRELSSSKFDSSRNKTEPYSQPSFLLKASSAAAALPPNAKISAWLKTPGVKLRYVTPCTSETITGTDCKFCLAACRTHRQNHVYLLLNITEGWIQQRCHNATCRLLMSGQWPKLVLSQAEVLEISVMSRLWHKRPEHSDLIPSSNQMVAMEKRQSKKRTSTDEESEDDDNRGTVDDSHSIVTSVEWILDGMLLKQSIKSAFGGSTATFHAMVSFKKFAQDDKLKWILLLRDGTHITTSIRTDRSLYSLVKDMKVPSVVEISDVTVLFDPPEAVMIIMKMKILRATLDLETEFDNRYGKPSRLDVKCRTPQILRPVRIFEITKDSLNVCLTIALTRVERGSWTSKGKSGEKLTFVGSDETGSIRGAAFSAIETLSELVTDGASVTINYPKFKIPDDPSFNEGYTTPFELRFSSLTTVVSSNTEFKVDVI